MWNGLAAPPDRRGPRVNAKGARQVLEAACSELLRGIPDAMKILATRELAQHVVWPL